MALSPFSVCAQQPLLAEYKEHHTDMTVHFILEVLAAKMAELTAGGLDSKLKLSTKFSTSECKHVNCFLEPGLHSW